MSGSYTGGQPASLYANGDSSGGRAWMNREAYVLSSRWGQRMAQQAAWLEVVKLPEIGSSDESSEALLSRRPLVRSPEGDSRQTTKPPASFWPIRRVYHGRHRLESRTSTGRAKLTDRIISTIARCTSASIGNSRLRLVLECVSAKSHDDSGSSCVVVCPIRSEAPLEVRAQVFVEI